MIQPEIFADIDIKQEVTDFFQTYFDYTLTQEDYDQIMCTEMNANSAK